MVSKETLAPMVVNQRSLFLNLPCNATVYFTKSCPPAIGVTTVVSEIPPLTIEYISEVREPKTNCILPVEFIDSSKLILEGPKNECLETLLKLVSVKLLTLPIFMPALSTALKFKLAGASFCISNILNSALELTAMFVSCCFFSDKKSPVCTLFLSEDGKLSQ